MFELSGVKVLRASHPDEVRDVVEAAAGQAYNACTPTAVLLSQRLIGAKVFREMSKANLLERRSVVSSLLASAATPSWSVVSVLPPMTSPRPAITIATSISGAPWAAAVMIGLGVALAQPKMRCW